MSRFLVAASLAVGCVPKPPATRSDRGAAFATDEIAASVDADGVTVGALVPQSKTTQILKAAPETNIGAAAVAFPPGALAVQGVSTLTVSLQEGAAIVSSANARTFGLGEGLAQTGQAVVIAASAPVNAAQPFVLSIPLPSQASLRLAGEADNLAVAYLVRDAETQKTFQGLIPPSDVSVDAEKGLVNVRTKYFGSYQAILVPTPVTSVVRVETQTEVTTKVQEKALPPLKLRGEAPATARAGEDVVLAFENLRPAAFTLRDGTRIMALSRAPVDGAVSFAIPRDTPSGPRVYTVVQDPVRIDLKISIAAAALPGDGSTSTPDASVTPSLALVDPVPSPNAASTVTVKLRAVGASHWRWQAGAAGVTDCANPGAYGAVTGVTDQITVEAAPLPNGPLAMCVMLVDAAGKGLPNPLRVTWTKDASPPDVTMSFAADQGPGLQPGTTMEWKGAVSDAGCGVAALAVSVGKSGGGCFDTSSEMFSGACPTWKTMASPAQWQVSVPKTSFVDGQSYVIDVKAKDACGNEGVATRSFTWHASPNFSGLKEARLATSTRRAFLRWDRAMLGGVDMGFTYGVFSAPDAASFDFGNVPFLSLNDVTAKVTPPLPPNDVSFAVKASQFDGNWDANTKSATLRLGKGFVHTVMGEPRYEGAYPDEYVPGQSAGAALKIDPFGNVVIPRVTSVVVLCRETSAPYCRGKAPGFFYTIAGRMDGSDGSDTPVADVRMNITDLALGPGSNIFVTDRNLYLRALCFDVTVPGPCQGKTAGRQYIVVDAVFHAADGADGVSITNAMGIARSTRSVAVDPKGNIFVNDWDAGYVRVLCYNAAPGSYCEAKTFGNHYLVAGNGNNTGNGTDGIAANTASLGKASSMTWDDEGNLVLVDFNYKYIRMICLNTSGVGFCAGKSPGFHYRIAGTGVTGDPSGTVTASSSPFGAVYTLATDGFNNLVFANVNVPKVRVICLTTNGFFCTGKTKGSLYTVAGTGASGNAADGTPLLANPTDAKAVAVAPEGNLWLEGSLLRMACVDTANRDMCAGKTLGTVYTIAGKADGTFPSTVYTSQLPVRSNAGLATDTQGNVVMAGGGEFYALCHRTGIGGPCNSVPDGRTARLLKATAFGDGADGLADANAVFGAAIGAFALDGGGNIYWFDATYYRVRAYCRDVLVPGFCQGKTQGNVYRIAGTGAQGNPADAVLASSAAVGYVIGLAVDTFGNVFYGEADNNLIRVHCATSAGSFCAGKATGKIYIVAGDGSFGAPSFFVSARSSPLQLNGLALDAAGNPFTTTNNLIYAVCLDVSQTGFCQGKNPGYINAVVGNLSTAGIAVDGADLATAYVNDIPYAIGFDRFGNLYYADTVVHAVCLNTANPGFCQGRPPRTLTTVMGKTSPSSAPLSNVLAVNTNTQPSSLALDADGNLWATEMINELNTTILRLVFAQ